MQLRNKKTGEIKEVEAITIGGFRSLAELNEEWEDYEDPKMSYFINWFGEASELSGHINVSEIEKLKQIDNYFETKEEAEKAVEKLKAVKRLKDKGFEIESWTNDIGDNYYKTGQIVLNLNNVKNREWKEYEQIMEIKNDLDLLFGGKEFIRIMKKERKDC